MLRTYREREDPYRNSVTYVSEEPAASVIKVEMSDEMERMTRAEKQGRIATGILS
jgi:hypothetical protein